LAAITDKSVDTSGITTLRNLKDILSSSIFTTSPRFLRWKEKWLFPGVWTARDIKKH
jgi:hypothetical protein